MTACGIRGWMRGENMAEEKDECNLQYMEKDRKWKRE